MIIGWKDNFVVNIYLGGNIEEKKDAIDNDIMY